MRCLGSLAVRRSAGARKPQAQSLPSLLAHQNVGSSTSCVLGNLVVGSSASESSELNSGTELLEGTGDASPEHEAVVHVTVLAEGAILERVVAGTKGLRTCTAACMESASERLHVSVPVKAW